MAARFRDRHDAGVELASHLAAYKDWPDVLVLALPRGGVPVGFEVAKALNAPLDVFLVRKLGVPGHEELAMGAIATGGTVVLNADVVEGLRIPDRVIEAVAMREAEELARRERAYRNNRPPPDVQGRTIFLVDDGLATGSTMRAAAKALQQQDPASIILAAPVASQQTCEEFRREGYQIICARTPEPFYAVGLWYEDFTPTSDQEVRELLEQAQSFNKERDGQSQQSPAAIK